MLQKNIEVMHNQLKLIASEAMRINGYHIKAPWLHPSQQAARKNILRCVLISICTVAAFAAVLPNGKVLLNLQPARRANLRCAVRVNLYNSSSESLGLITKYPQETSPPGIHDSPGQPAVPDHSLNVQAFHSDRPVAHQQSVRDFMMKIQSAPCDLSMCTGKPLALFVFRVRPASFSNETPVFNRKGSPLSAFRINWRLEVPVASHQEILKPKVNSTSGEDAIWYRVINPRSYYSVPLVTLSLNRNNLVLSDGFAMNIDRDSANVGDVEFPASNSTAVMGSATKAVVLPGFLESWKCCLFLIFYHPKEIDEREVERPDSPSRRRTTDPLEPSVVFSGGSVPIDLVEVFQSFLFYGIGGDPLSEAGIVEAPVSFEGDFELATLVGVWIDPVLEFLVPHLSVTLDKIIDRPTYKFGIAYAALQCERFERFELLIANEQIDADHTYMIHTMIGVVNG